MVALDIGAAAEGTLAAAVLENLEQKVVNIADGKRYQAEGGSCTATPPWQNGTQLGLLPTAFLAVVAKSPERALLLSCC